MPEQNIQTYSEHLESLGRMEPIGNSIDQAEFERRKLKLIGLLRKRLKQLGASETDQVPAKQLEELERDRGKLGVMLSRINIKTKEQTETEIEVATRAYFKPPVTRIHDIHGLDLTEPDSFRMPPPDRPTHNYPNTMPRTPNFI